MMSTFKAMRGFSNTHFQTILPSLLNKKEKVSFVHQTLDLDDGDFLDLAWQNNPDKDDRDIVIIFHGLEGSVYSSYAYRMMRALDLAGFNAVVMHFRGCFKEPNRLPRAYHSGETGDAKQLLKYLQTHYPKRQLSAIGYSLGGNMLMKLQGELGVQSPLKRVVSVSSPLKLELSAKHIQKWGSRFYQWYLMESLRNSLLEKFKDHDYKKLINLEKSEVAKLRTFWAYDDAYTGPIHGFKDAQEYYERSSASQYLDKITTPALIIHAEDDPFMPVTVLPDEKILPSQMVVELSPHGGHVGFIGGTLLKPSYWLETRIPTFLKGL